MKGTRISGHAKRPYKLTPLVAVNGGPYVGRTCCECGAVSPILRGEKARRAWYQHHLNTVIATGKATA